MLFFFFFLVLDFRSKFFNNFIKNYYFDEQLLLSKKVTSVMGINVRTYVFHMLRTYVMILYNWLIFWQNALYLYLGRFMMCLNTLRNYVSRSSVETFKSFQKSSKECKFIKTRHLFNNFSTPPIYRGLRNSEFNYDFLGSVNMFLDFLFS